MDMCLDKLCESGRFGGSAGEIHVYDDAGTKLIEKIVMDERMKYRYADRILLCNWASSDIFVAESGSFFMRFASRPAT